MNLSTLVNLVNKKLAGELLTYKEMVTYLDQAVDDINTLMNTTFPVFSELEAGATVYNAFPDMYIRQVVVPGAAWAFYTVDEEGVETARQYNIDFQTNKFTMLRDYLPYVDEKYSGLETGGMVGPSESLTLGNNSIATFNNW